MTCFLSNFIFLYFYYFFPFHLGFFPGAGWSWSPLQTIQPSSWSRWATGGGKFSPQSKIHLGDSLILMFRPLVDMSLSKLQFWTSCKSPMSKSILFKRKILSCSSFQNFNLYLSWFFLGISATCRDLSLATTEWYVSITSSLVCLGALFISVHYFSLISFLSGLPRKQTIANYRQVDSQLVCVLSKEPTVKKASKARQRFVFHCLYPPKYASVVNSIHSVIILHYSRGSCFWPLCEPCKEVIVRFLATSKLTINHLPASCYVQNYTMSLATLKLATLLNH